MKLGFRLTCIEVGERGTLYSVQFDDQEVSEFDRFADDPQCQASPDFDDVLGRLYDMLDRYGFQERFFKWEASARDSVSALHYDNGPLRLYCCRWGRIILIAGYGGVKKTRTYEEDPRLHDAVKRMQHVDKQLAYGIRNKDAHVDPVEQRLMGDLEFKPEDLI